MEEHHSSDDLVAKFIRNAKTEQKVTPPVVTRKSRLVTGALLGVLISATYGFVAETINFILTPGIPFYFHPFGAIGNILYIVLLGVITGIVCSWPEKALTGAGIGSLTIFIGMEIRQIISIGFPFSILVFTAYGLFALVAIAWVICLSILFVGLLRIAIDIQSEKSHLNFWNWQRVRMVLLILVIAVIAGSFHTLSDSQIFALKTANRLVKQGLQFQNTAQLPSALQDENVEDFVQNASNTYQLEVNDFMSNNFVQLFPGIEIGSEDHVVMIYFGNDWKMACLIRVGKSTKCASERRMNNFMIY
jgi:hypothetical protein